MSVKTRNLGLEIYYLFNGRDFIVNENLSDMEFQDIMHFCRENDPDCKKINLKIFLMGKKHSEGKSN
ncbi:MAG: hypothetical protein VR68_08315 [Peptococcaceae bacterium BRH_c4a]|nr:MAG: hypothetical protein VR68_08315 [Peptococcaceae bacterium BRH_c4a]